MQPFQYTIIVTIDDDGRCHSVMTVQNLNTGKAHILAGKAYKKLSEVTSRAIGFVRKHWETNGGTKLQ